MNKSFLAVIKRITAEQGENILSDPKRLKPLVSELASAEPKEDRIAFGRAVENGFYMELKRSSSADRTRVKASLVSRLKTITGFDTARCSAAVDLLEAVTAPAASVQSVPVQNVNVSSPASPAGFSKPQISKRTLLFAIAAGAGAFLGEMISNGTGLNNSETLASMNVLLNVGLWAGLIGLGISVGLILMQTVYLKKQALPTIWWKVKGLNYRDETELRS